MASCRTPGPVGFTPLVALDSGAGVDQRLPRAGYSQPGTQGERGLTPEQQELALDIVQITLDIVGIFEPTPFADGTNALISIGRGDWLGAGLSGLGMIPYIGDLAKAGKLPRYAQKIADAIRMARSNAEFDRLLRPALGNLKKALDQIPGNLSPELAKMVDSLKRPLESYLGAAKLARRLSLTERLVAARLGSIDNVGTLVWKNIETAKDYFVRHGIPEQKMIEALHGMDVHSAIEIVEFKKGDMLRQSMQNPNELGEWFVKAGGGVGEESIGIAHGNRVNQQVQASETISALKSKAANVDDFFTAGRQEGDVRILKEGERQWVKSSQAGSGFGARKKAWSEAYYDPKSAQMKVRHIVDKKTGKMGVSMAVGARGGGTQYFIPRSAQAMNGNTFTKVASKVARPDTQK